MSLTTTSFTQSIYKGQFPPVQTSVLKLSELSDHTFDPLFLNQHDNLVGVAAEYGTQCRLTSLAIACATHVFVVSLEAGGKAKAKGKGKDKNVQVRSVSGLGALQEVLSWEDWRQVGFDMDRIATSLFMDHRLRITGGVDLESVSGSGNKNIRGSLGSIMSVLGGEQVLNKDIVKRIFCDGTSKTPHMDLALRAWASLYAGRRPEQASRVVNIPVIDTSVIDDQDLLVLCKLRRDADLLYALKPTKVKNDVAKEFVNQDGKLHLSCERFSTKIRTSATQATPSDTPQSIVVETVVAGKKSSVAGRAVRTSGRAAQVGLSGAASVSTVKAVYTIGKEDPTSAEAQRAQIVRMALQGTISFFQLPFIAAIWRPAHNQVAPASSVTCPVYFPQRELNDAQIRAVERALDPSEMITTIQGPPGSGKTTVIAAIVTTITVCQDPLKTVWLVAQSNVAVKNIAEKLADCGFEDFKLIVSKDFHFDWHEHLYEKIERNVIRADALADGIVGVERQILDSRVILCTLSMITHPRLQKVGLTRLVPVSTVIVDEASQIEIGDYVPLMQRYASNLTKIVFIGDDEQHRMPVPIGAFISRHVYKGKLKSVHGITARTSCMFIDVAHGSEEKMGNSFWNPREVQIVVHLVRRLARLNAAFRVITPYDGQRTKLESAIKSNNLPWEDKVFNVDSFQGNEEEVILISLVRTDKVGFLSNMRNSMLICTNKAFLSTKAKNTLVGKLADEWGPEAWRSWQNIISGAH
ncbi:hypothetical protein PUNSTDRAFT_44029 [Punctularia strigosozonata HHB-11173 SS5]|uniref:uncharacterized protein n=1 Tax=Punctularia strigosozonata (strain HHB-11173) TaxID=741275 RepID=UPI0004416FAA|nr:uncharacterized protein PUNSTDRAFT_44029 [Punctularia strigosozonata HHB-11173 SS5]EIN09738.1 hypothetical protein PUNSTDRAFT_44029 [Punctularia strigosozonata HHB-11173 SS5]